MPAKVSWQVEESGRLLSSGVTRRQGLVLQRTSPGHPARRTQHSSPPEAFYVSPRDSKDHDPELGATVKSASARVPGVYSQHFGHGVLEPSHTRSYQVT